MVQSKWLLGVISVVGLASACSSDANTGKPIPAQGGSGGASAGGPASGGGGASNGGASNGGASAATCTPACSADQACVVTTCRPKPVELTSVSGCGQMHLAVSKGTLYFTDLAHGNVKSVPVAGGAVADVATGQKAPYAVAVDDAGVVYWSTSSTTVQADNTLMMKAPTGTPTKVTNVKQPADAAKTYIAKYITVGGTFLYYGAGDDLLKVEAKAAATPLKLGTFDGQPTAIVLSPPLPAATTRIFTTLGLDNAVQWRAPDPAASGCTDPVTRPLPKTGESAAEATARINGGGCAFSESVGNLMFDTMNLAGTNIVFADGTTIQVADTTVASTMQATRTQVAETESFDPISGFTNTATTVYFGESSTGIIEKATLPKGKPVILVQDPVQISPSAFVNDGTNLYWHTGASATDACTIYKLPL